MFEKIRYFLNLVLIYLLVNIICRLSGKFRALWAFSDFMGPKFAESSYFINSLGGISWRDIMALF